MHNIPALGSKKDAQLRPLLLLDVLQQFRVIYGSMRQHFREVEQRCGLPGTQMWLLQEVQLKPGVGITALAGRLGIHQSTCSQLVEKLVEAGYVEKVKQKNDRRRIGLYFAPRESTPWPNFRGRQRASCRRRSTRCPTSRSKPCRSTSRNWWTASRTRTSRTRQPPWRTSFANSLPSLRPLTDASRRYA